MNETNKSEVARLREQIALEYEAAQRGLTGLAATARHQFITKRQENIGACFEKLSKIMPSEEAIAIVAETLTEAQSRGSSSGNTS